MILSSEWKIKIKLAKQLKKKKQTLKFFIRVCYNKVSHYAANEIP